MRNQLTQFIELNSVELVVNVCCTSERSSELILFNPQSVICHATDDLLLIDACMSIPVETQLIQRLKGC